MNITSNIKRERIVQELSPKTFSKIGVYWVIALSIMCSIGLFAYVRQLNKGLVVTNMGDYVSWGIYISNFVFFVAISLVGSLITAIFRLANIEWSKPLTRIAEIIAVSAIFLASLIIIVDMGRPERLLNLALHPRLQSPIMWDVVVIGTYLIISVLLLYFPMIPDLKLLSKANSAVRRTWPQGIYKVLSSFWTGSSEQRKNNGHSITILSILIIPVAFCIHTVTSWLFATTYRPGWDSTNFGAYFVSGAFLVGAGGVVIAMYVIRRAYQLEHYITEAHFDRMGKAVVLLCFLYLYFNINEYLVPAFKMKKPEEAHLTQLFAGSFAPMFWFAVIVGMLLPILILINKWGRSPGWTFAASIMVVIGAWFKRYLIVTPTLLHPLLPMQDVPERFKHYFPSWEEWAIAMGSLAGAMLIITLFVRFFPIIPIQETITGHDEEEEKLI